VPLDVYVGYPVQATSGTGLNGYALFGKPYVV